MGDLQKKILMWCCQRTMSEAFYRSMTSRLDTVGIIQPFYFPYHCNPDGLSDNHPEWPKVDKCTFAEQKQICEEYYPDYDVVFVKEMARMFVGRIDKQHIPEGYTHVFLIRHPSRCFRSLYRLSQDPEAAATRWDKFEDFESGYRELFKMYEFVTTQLGQDPIVIDADDLLDNPEAMLRDYCEHVGIPYLTAMLEWEKEPQPYHMDKHWTPFYRTVLKHNTFVKTTKVRNDISDLPEIVQQKIEKNIPYYNQLYAQRHILEN